MKTSINFIWSSKALFIKKVLFHNTIYTFMMHSSSFVRCGPLHARAYRLYARVVRPLAPLAPSQPPSPPARLFPVLSLHWTMISALVLVLVLLTPVPPRRPPLLLLLLLLPRFRRRLARRGSRPLVEYGDGVFIESPEHRTPALPHRRSLSRGQLRNGPFAHDVVESHLQG